MHRMVRCVSSIAIFCVLLSLAVNVYAYQDSTEKISFRGNIGPLINCETFSYELFIGVPPQPSVPVIIEIIDPDGNVAGRDEFESSNYDSPRIFELDWKKGGIYVIQVQYKGVLHQDDFSYNERSPENYQGYRNICLKQEYITSIRDETFQWFNFLTDPYNDDFQKNVRIAEELIRDSNAEHFIDIVSEKSLNAILSRTKQVDDIEKLYSVLPEFRALLADLIEQRVISIFQDSEDRLTTDPDIALDEKTELIFELRKVRDNEILTQRQYAEKYADSVYKIYSNAKSLQDNIERNKELTSIRIQADKEKELQIAQEKELIKHEILSKEIAEPNMSFEEKIPTPKKQIQNGILHENVICKESLKLISKNDGSSACVTHKTAEKLIERGWGYN